MAYQSTLSGPAVCAGVGLHTGERVRLALKPAEIDTGIVFVRSDITDKNNVIPAHAENVTTTQLGTTLSNEDGVTVSTVEHLMAACAGVGLDNLIIEIDGPEAPIMDGSSALYCRLLLQTGLTEQAAPKRRLRILKPVTIEAGGSTLSFLPPEEKGAPFELRVRIDFDNQVIGEQLYTFQLTPGAFVDQLAFARTFGFAQDVEKLHAMGLARGASMDNAVVLDGDTILNPEGLRVADEFVRHKILDAVGDLHLAGGYIEGVFEGDKPGHGVNNQLVCELLKRTDAWEWVSDEVEAVDDDRVQPSTIIASEKASAAAML